MVSKNILSGIREYEREIRYMDAEDLRSEFGFVSSDRLNVAKLIRNLAWQAYTGIRDGKREKIDSNIRTRRLDSPKRGTTRPWRI